MKILHISPTYFSRTSVMGGGERYALELARAMSRHHEVCFLSFADKAEERQEGELRVKHLRKGPFAFAGIFSQVLWSDVVHCHQVYRFENDLAILFAKLLGKKVYSSDLGGWGRFSLCYHYPLLKHTDGFLLLSDYSKKLWNAPEKKNRADQMEVVYGGVDTEKFVPGERVRNNHVLYVGRLVSHKGIDYLVDAMEQEMLLRLIGHPYDDDYFELLKEKAASKNVQFDYDVKDEKLVAEYQTALVTVQTSVYTDHYGRHTDVPELLGLSALESMACGTPVIVSDVASLPEIVEDGVTGFIVPPNDAKAIAEKISYLKAHPKKVEEMGKCAREAVLKRFTWERVAEHCVDVYRSQREQSS